MFGNSNLKNRQIMIVLAEEIEKGIRNQTLKNLPVFLKSARKICNILTIKNTALPFPKGDRDPGDEIVEIVTV